MDARQERVLRAAARGELAYDPEWVTPGARSRVGGAKWRLIDRNGHTVVTVTKTAEVLARIGGTPLVAADGRHGVATPEGRAWLDDHPDKENK